MRELTALEVEEVSGGAGFFAQLAWTVFGGVITEYVVYMMGGPEGMNAYFQAVDQSLSQRALEQGRQYMANPGAAID